LAVVRALGPAISDGLGFDLRRAIRACRVRLLAIHTVDRRPLPSNWAIPLRDSEAVVACAPLPPPFVGVAAVVARLAELPRAKLDDELSERIAQALADGILADLTEKR
jgi:hypothetical protein